MTHGLSHRGGQRILDQLINKSILKNDIYLTSFCVNAHTEEYYSTLFALQFCSGLKIPKCMLSICVLHLYKNVGCKSS